MPSEVSFNPRNSELEEKSLILNNDTFSVMDISKEELSVRKSYGLANLKNIFHPNEKDIHKLESERSSLLSDIDKHYDSL